MSGRLIFTVELQINLSILIHSWSLLPTLLKMLTNAMQQSSQPNSQYGKELRHMHTEIREQEGYTQTFEVYGCADCSGCEHKVRCLYKYDSEKNKAMKIN